jgi:hypothetical protein
MATSVATDFNAVAQRPREQLPVAKREIADSFRISRLG